MVFAKSKADLLDINKYNITPRILKMKLSEDQTKNYNHEHSVDNLENQKETIAKNYKSMNRYNIS